MDDEDGISDAITGATVGFQFIGPLLWQCLKNISQNAVTDFNMALKSAIFARPNKPLLSNAADFEKLLCIGLLAIFLRKGLPPQQLGVKPFRHGTLQIVGQHLA